MTHLIPRELLVLQLYAQGLDAPKIAAIMKTTDSAVYHLATRMRYKLGADTMSHAVAIAYQKKILE